MKSFDIFIVFLKWMNHSYEGIKFKRLNSLKKFLGYPCCSRFHLPSFKLFAICVFFQVFCPALVLGCKKLRVTSLLLIVLASRKGSHWVLATLPYFGTMASLKSMGMEKCRGHLQATRRFEAFPFIPHWAWAYLGPTSFIGRILSSSCLS